MSIKWGEIRLHNGSAECPPEARDAPCMILEQSRWLGATGARRGSSWKWRNVTAYRLPAHISASPEVRALHSWAEDAQEALISAMEEIVELRLTLGKSDLEPPWLSDAIDQSRAALAAFNATPPHPPATDIDDPLNEIAPLPQAEE